MLNRWPFRLGKKHEDGSEIGVDEPTYGSPMNSLFMPKFTTGDRQRANSYSHHNSESALAAMKAQRAFRLMALSFKDDDHHDGEDEEHREAPLSPAASDTSPLQLQLTTVSADQFNGFKQRMQVLEDLVEDQAAKLQSMDEIIEEQVKLRSKERVEKLELKLKTLQEQSEADIEKRVQQRLEKKLTKLQQSTNGPSSDIATKRKNLKSFFSAAKFSIAKGTTTLTRSTGTSAAALQVPDIHEASKEELLDLVEVMNTHILTQDAHLVQAQQMIDDAIQERNEATVAAHEAFNLSAELDDRLQSILKEGPYLSFETRFSESSNASGGERRRSAPTNSTLDDADLPSTPRGRQSA